MVHLQIQEMQETWDQHLGREDPLEEEMATHCSVLVWRIPWTQEPRGLESKGSQRVRHNPAHTERISKPRLAEALLCIQCKDKCITLYAAQT